MFLEGLIITHGKLAATISVGNVQQYYAPYEEISLEILPLLALQRVRVVFEADFSMFSGRSRHGPRFYARRVVLKDTIFL